MRRTKKRRRIQPSARPIFIVFLISCPNITQTMGLSTFSYKLYHRKSLVTLSMNERNILHDSYQDIRFRRFHHSTIHRFANRKNSRKILTKFINNTKIVCLPCYLVISRKNLSKFNRSGFSQKFCEKFVFI